MLALSLLSRDKIQQIVRFWSSESKEMLALSLLSRDKIQQTIRFWSSESKEMLALRQNNILYPNGRHRVMNHRKKILTLHDRG